MLRFIDLGTQIDEEVNYFTFYDTIQDRFVSFMGNSTWHSWADFEQDYKDSKYTMIKRFQRLFDDHIKFS